jgi:hypothetical protein
VSTIQNAKQYTMPVNRGPTARRVRPSRPFAVTSVDCPLYVKARGRRKGNTSPYSHASPLEQCTLDYARIWQLLSSSWHFNDSLVAWVSRIGLQKKTLRYFRRHIWSSSRFCTQCPVARPISFMPNTVQHGCLSHHERLGGEAGRRVEEDSGYYKTLST